jgi:bacteriocin-like protein
MTKFNTECRELTIDELETVSGGNGVTINLYGNTIHFGTDQTGAPYISLHGADGTNSVVRGTPK